MIVHNLIGRNFGRLIVQKEIGRTKAQKKLWFCVCSCGGTTITTTGDLLNGTTQSCGCLQRERTGKANKKHGKSYSRIYSIWRTMIRRCTDSNAVGFDKYGGRGITVCERWKSLDLFHADMGDPPAGKTLERKNNDLGYSPSNCCWATMDEQARNRTTNVKIDGLCLADWAKILNCNPSTLSRYPHRCKIVGEKDLKEIGLEK